MSENNRIQSIDIMRGLTLFLMLFVNDLYVPGVPQWLVHTKETVDGMGLADWVFPGFLFMVGLSIPFAFSASKKNFGELAKHIAIRTFSLIVIGIFMISVSGINDELTGMSQSLWAILAYVSVFLIWNKYPKGSKWERLKYLGIASLLILAYVYKGGTVENPTRMEKGWWGILGLIAWGYFAAAFTYLFFKDSLLKVGFVWLMFLMLNILSQLGYTDWLNSIKPLFGVIVSGNIPLMVVSGLLIGVLLKKYRANAKTFLIRIILLGMASLAVAYLLNQWFIISKIMGTPSWALLCTGISILVFAGLYYLIDVKKILKPFALFKPAGENSLSTYLAPDIIYYAIWTLPFQVLIYKQDEMPLLAVIGSLLWATAMVLLAAFLTKLNIKLKL